MIRLPKAAPRQIDPTHQHSPRQGNISTPLIALAGAASPSSGTAFSGVLELLKSFEELVDPRPAGTRPSPAAQPCNIGRAEETT